jgi:hypothetical protein
LDGKSNGRTIQKIVSYDLTGKPPKGGRAMTIANGVPENVEQIRDYKIQINSRYPGRDNRYEKMRPIPQ